MMNGRVLVSATVLSLKDSKFSYPCCRICYSKVYTKEDEKLKRTLWVCLKCKEQYEAKQVKLRYRLVLRITDGDHQADTTVFGTCLDRFFGAGADQFQRYVDSIDVPTEAPEQLVKQSLQDTFIGQMFIFGFKVNCKRTNSQKLDRSPLKLSEIMDEVEKTNHSGFPSTQNGSNQSLVAIQMILSNRNQTTVTVMDNIKNYMKPQTRLLDETGNSLTPFSQESVTSSCGSTCSMYDYGQDSVLLSCEKMIPAKKESQVLKTFSKETKSQELTQLDRSSQRSLDTKKHFDKNIEGKNCDSPVSHILYRGMNSKQSDMSRTRGKTKDELLLTIEKEVLKSKQRSKSSNSSRNSSVTHQKSFDGFLETHWKSQNSTSSCDSVEIGRHASVIKEGKGTFLESLSPTNSGVQNDNTELNDSVFLNLSMPIVIKPKEPLSSQETIIKSEVTCSELPYSEDIEEYLNMMDDSFDNYIKTEDLEHFSEDENCKETETNTKADSDKCGEIDKPCDEPFSLQVAVDPGKKNKDIFEDKLRNHGVTPKNRKCSTKVDGASFQSVQRNKDNSLHEKFVQSVFKDVEEFMNKSGVFEEASQSKQGHSLKIKELNRSFNGMKSAGQKNHVQEKSKDDVSSPEGEYGENKVIGSQGMFDCSSDMFDTSYGSKCSQISTCESPDPSEDLFGSTIQSDTDSPCLITKTPGVHSEKKTSGERKKSKRKSVYFSHILEDSQTIDNIDLIMRCTPTKKHQTPLRTCLKDTPVNAKTKQESSKPTHKRNCSKGRAHLDSPAMILRQKYARCLKSTMERNESTPLSDLGKFSSNKKPDASPIYDENQNALQSPKSEIVDKNKSRNTEESNSEFEESFVAGTQSSPSVLGDRTNMIKWHAKLDKKKNNISLQATQHANVNEIKPRKLMFASSSQESEKNRAKKREDSRSEFEDSFVVGTQCSPNVLSDRTNLIKQHSKSDKRRNVISLQYQATQQANVNEIKPRKLFFTSSQGSGDLNTSVVVASQDLFSDDSFW